MTAAGTMPPRWRLPAFDTPGYAVEDIVFKDITIQKPSVTLPLRLCRGITLSNISCVEP